MNGVIELNLMDTCLNSGMTSILQKSEAPADASVIPFPSDDSFDLKRITRNISAGDEDSFNLFYDRYAHRIYGYLLTVSHGDEHLTRDAMQETMMRIIRYIKAHKEEEVFWRWLKRISRTALYDLARKNTTYSKHIAVLKDEPDKVHGDVFDKHESRWKDALDVALAAIAEFDRKLVEGFYFDGYSQFELATQNNTSRKSIESRLARAREKMRVKLVRALSDD